MALPERELRMSAVDALMRRLKIDVERYKRVETTRSIKLDGRYIADLLRAAGVAIPDKAVVYFSVPGGGDWSNTDIDVSTENPVCIMWKEIEDEST